MIKRQLSKREKAAVGIALTCICLYVMVDFAVLPYLAHIDRLERRVSSRTRVLAEMKRLQGDYQALSARADLTRKRYAGRQKGFTLFSFMDKLAGQVKVKKHMTYMKPTTTPQKNSPFKLSQVEMKLEGLTLKQLTAYLYRIETSKDLVFIKRMSITKTSKQQGLIDAVLQVETLET